MARMEGVEKWADSGSISKVELTGFGNKMDVCGMREGIRGRERKVWAKEWKDGETVS